MRKELGLVKLIHKNTIGVKKWFFVVFLVSLITNLLTIILSIINKQIFDNFAYLDNRMLIIIVIVLVFSYLIIGILNFSSKLLNAVTNNRIKVKMQLNFYKSVQEIDYAFFLKNNSSAFFFRMFNDVNSLVDFYVKLVIDFPIRLIAFIFTLVLMFYWSVGLTIIAIALVAFQWILAFSFMKPLNSNLKILKEQEQSVMGKINLDFQQTDIIRSLSMENYKFKETEKVLNKYVKRNIKQTKLTTIYGESGFAVSGIGGVLILIYGLSQVQHGLITIGTIMAFTMLMTYFGSALSGIIGLYTQYHQSKVSHKRVSEYTGKRDEKINKYHETFSDNYNIKIKGLSFNYDNKTIYSNFNLNIDENSIILIKGGNGTGKTTLCKLLARFLYPEAGQIYIGNKNIEDIDIDLYRETILYNGQTMIIEDSFRRNIDFKGDFTDREIYDIIKECNLSEVLERKNWTLDDPVVIKENELSQGEKQKISIARILIRHPKILILDEPTANLDTTTTNQIINHLIRYHEENTNATIIITSHDQRLDELIDKKINL